MKFDDALVYLGDFGTYQRRLYLLVCIPVIMCGLQTMVNVFLTATPKHRCYVPGMDNPDNLQYQMPHMNVSIPLDQEEEEYRNCRWYNRTLNQTTGDVEGDTTLLTCDRFVFDVSVYHTSIVTEWQLVCDDAIWKQVSLAVIMVGVLVGSVVFGALSDKFGRKTIFYACSIVNVGVCVGSAFSPTFEVYLVLRFFVGALGTGTCLTSFVIDYHEEHGGEFYTDKERIALIATTFLLSFSGITGNSLVVLLVTLTKSLRNVSYMLITALAVSDMICNLGLLMSTISELAYALRLPDLPEIFNDTCAMVVNFGWFSSLNLFSIIAVDRFTCTMFFDRYKKLFTKRNTAILIACSFAVTAIYTIPAIFKGYLITFQPNYMAYTYTYYPGSVYMFYYDFAMSLFAALTVIVCYVAVIIKVKKTRKAVGNAQNAPKNNQKLKEFKLTIQLAIILGVFVGMIMFVFATHIAEKVSGFSWPKWAVITLNTLVSMNYCVNPVVYFSFNRVLRKRLFAGHWCTVIQN